jgi:hypothetical protein
MKTIKGPGIFLAQFAGDAAPFNTLEGMAAGRRDWALPGFRFRAGTGGCSILKLAAESQAIATRCLAWPQAGLAVTELSTHLQGQLVASIRPSTCCSRALRRQSWPATRRRARPGLCSSCCGRQRPAATGIERARDFFRRAGVAVLLSLAAAAAGLIDEAFKELGARWLPILQAFDEAGVDVCFELHPGEDLHDGVTFERFLGAVGDHPRANILYDPSHMILQQMDYLAFLDIYHDRVRAFHVKDAEFRPAGARASMAAIRIGSIGRGVSARWAMGRSTSARSSARWRSTTIRAGR